jgi:hypothetical protein
MGLFRDTIRDARRQVRSGNQIIQRMSGEPVQEIASPPLPPSPPIEEQPDGSLTIYRFQKEGQLVPREVPNRVETGPEQRRRVDPSSKVERSSESEGRVTQVIDDAILLDDTSVIASRRKNGLETGKGDKAHAMRQDSTVNEASSIGLHGLQQQVSDDLSSIESPPDRNDPVDTYSSDNLQRETGERELSRDAGLGTPSETFTSQWSAEHDGAWPVSNQQQPSADGEQPPTPSPQATVSYSSRPDLSEPPPGGEVTDRAPEAVPQAIPVTEAAYESSAEPEQAVETFTAPHSEVPGKRMRPEQTESRVIIGQVDVVVVSNPPAPKAPAQAAHSKGMASRRYWRRL